MCSENFVIVDIGTAMWLQRECLLQLRMPDGSRLVARMNHTHTVGDIRHFVQTVQPTYHTTDFGLMTTFPFAELTNLAQTVSEAKLLNSAIVIKTK